MWQIAAASLLGGALGAKGAKDAARIGADASREGIAEQRRQFDIGQRTQAPWLQAGSNALSAYSGYGRSQVNPNQSTPNTSIPRFSYGGQRPGVGNIPEYNVSSNIPQFDQSQLNAFADPSYQFRVQAGEDAINRNMGGMGKILSGNRLNELQSYGQNMASQEYSNMYGRALNDYGIKQQNEASQYGRDLTGYQMDVGREAGMDNRNVANEADAYTRAMQGYGIDAGIEADTYNRDLRASDMGYQRAYGQETDYLNRLAGISGVGQSTATGMGQQGMQFGSNVSNSLANMGAIQGAGRIGQAGAWQNALGDMSALYGMGAFNQGGSGWRTGATTGGYGGSGMTSRWR